MISFFWQTEIKMFYFLLQMLVEKLVKQINILIIIAFSIFVIKNISRLQYENDKYQYNVFMNPYFGIEKKNFYFQKIFSKLNFNYREKNDNYYLILDKDIINSIN